MASEGSYQRRDFKTFHGSEDLSRINSSPARAAGVGDLIRQKSSELKNLASVVFFPLPTSYKLVVNHTMCIDIVTFESNFR